VERMFAICLEFQIIYYFSNTPVHFCTYSGPSRFAYKTTSQVRVFRRLWVLKSQGLFQFASIIYSYWIGEVPQLQYSYLTLIRYFCVCQSLEHYRQVVFLLY